MKRSVDHPLTLLLLSIPFRQLSELHYQPLLHNPESGWLTLLSIRLLISAQVMILRFMGLSPASGSVLTVWSLLGILSPPLSAPPLLVLSLKINKNEFKKKKGGAWVAQSVKRPTSAQVVISRFVGLSPTLSSLDPPLSLSLSLSFSVPPPLVLSK